MREEIENFLRQNVSFKFKPLKAMKLVAEHFGGEVKNSRYVKIQGIEYKVEKDMDAVDWKVRIMTWEHGTNWKFVKPY